MNGYETPEIVLLAVLNQIGDGFPSSTIKLVSELVDHNEAGVALETLCSQILEYDIKLPEEYKTRLKSAAYTLAIPLSQLDGLSD